MIDFEKFLEWAEDRFGDVVVNGSEIMINSIFVEDYKHHLSCNPSGGKYELPHGVYHCWKSGKGGSLVSLVKQVDDCTYDEALERLDAVDMSLFNLEKKLKEFFSKKPEKKVIEVKLALPEQTHWITELDANDYLRIEAENYILNRKLNPADYMICKGGDYKNRIIIPYFDKNNNLIYWNGRLLKDSTKSPKYRGPNKDCGVGKGDVIYMPHWASPGVKMHVTEGEFDAKSISNSFLYACAIGGKYLEEKQLEILRPYIPVLCFDTDDKIEDAGGEALVRIGDMLISYGFSDVFYVRPPKKFKDWNKMLVDVGPKIINAYIEQHSARYTSNTRLELEIKRN